MFALRPSSYLCASAAISAVRIIGSWPRVADVDPAQGLGVGEFGADLRWWRQVRGDLEHVHVVTAREGEGTAGAGWPPARAGRPAARSAASASAAGYSPTTRPAWTSTIHGRSACSVVLLSSSM